MTDPALCGMTTESRHPATRELDRMSALDLVALMNAEDAVAVAAVQAVLPVIARAIDAVAARMQKGGRLIYVGAGTSGRLGVLDAVECRPTFSVPEGLVIGLIAGGEAALTRAVEGAEDDAERGRDDVSRLVPRSEDSVVGIAASGRTPYVLGALSAAKSVKALTIALVCNPGSAVAAQADLALEAIVGPEVLTGSTRLKSGTATKLICNMLSTGVMVRLGKCYENLRVDVQASNDKLRARARGIVAAATGLDTEAAAALLARCGGEVKTAIVAALVASGGRVRQALTLR